MNSEVLCWEDSVSDKLLSERLFWNDSVSVFFLLWIKPSVLLSCWPNLNFGPSGTPPPSPSLSTPLVTTFNFTSSSRSPSPLSESS